MMTNHELLAPAGRPDAGYAALHYGADAVYCGLAAFSARAEAVNFTPDELTLFARHAHSLTPKRRVYITLNTLLREDELPRAVDTAATALDCGADALIIQDLGLAKIAREHFPGVELHASTQMAVHNLDGVRTAKELGFRRVTLARELTLEEIADICENGGVEIETFIHGTLCYSYSGLCLFSSMMTGRSGNRGRCVYSCREAAETPAGRAHPFSLKDMALGEDVLKLAEAGVKSFKIEGRKKSPLYVGATVDYYRRLLDGTFAPGEEEERRARLQTIFARPWTKLFFHSRHNPDTADTEVVGHRGAPLGTVGGVIRTPSGPAIRFRPARAVERHDGLQIDIPGEARPFGFAVDNLYSIRKGAPESVFAAPADADIAVALPEDAPAISPGLPVYQSSSQAVKRSYPFARPRSDTPDPDTAADVRVTITKTGEAECAVAVAAQAETPLWLGGAARTIEAALTETAPAFPARDAAGAEASAQKAFSRTGGSRFFVDGWSFDNPDAVFVKPGDWNSLRRELLARLEQAYAEKRSAATAAITAAAARTAEENRTDSAEPAERWSLAVENPAQLDTFEAADRNSLAEVIVPHTAPPDALERLTDAFGKARLRLSLPVIARAEESAHIRARIETLTAAGFTNWLVPGPGYLPMLPREAESPAADWPLYALNHAAVEQLQKLGFADFTCSPEDDADNLARLLRAFPGRGWLTVHGDIPLFIAAACAHRHLGLCRGKSGDHCAHAPGGMRITMEKSGPATVLPQNCGSIVLSDTPFSLLHRLAALREMGATQFRVDLRRRPRTAEETLSLWRAVRATPEKLPGTEANFARGLT